MIIKPKPSAAFSPSSALAFAETDWTKDAGPSLLGFPPPERPNIPRVIHQVWVKDKRKSGAKTGEDGGIPAGEQAFIEGIKALHPEWGYRMWTEDDLPGLWAHDPFGLQRGYDKALNPGFQSDLLRLLILWLDGGVYADTDVKTVKPLDSLLDSCDAFIGATFWPQPHDRIFVENAILGFSPRHPFLTQVLAMLVETQHTWPERSEDFMETVTLTGPGMLSDELRKWRASATSMRSDVAIIPRRFLYAANYEETRAGFDSADFPDSYLFHLFHGKWFLHDF